MIEKRDILNSLASSERRRFTSEMFFMNVEGKQKSISKKISKAYEKKLNQSKSAFGSFLAVIIGFDKDILLFEEIGTGV